MSDLDRESVDQSPEGERTYSAPSVEELDATDGPAVTAAGGSQDEK